MRPEKRGAAPRATGQAAAPRVQAEYIASDFVRHFNIEGAPVTVDGRDDVVLAEIQTAGLWDALAPLVRTGLSVAIRFPGDRTRFAFWCGNPDNGGFVAYRVRPQDYAGLLDLTCRIHLGRPAAPIEAAP